MQAIGGLINGARIPSTVLFARAHNMAPKRKPASDKAPASKKAKKASSPTQQAVAAAEPAEVWFSVEHWAAELCKLLEEKVPGLEVKLNPSKPRKGCFEIQDQTGKTYVSLLNMPRPFKPLRELDIAKVADDMAASMTSFKAEEGAPAKDDDDNA